MSSYHRDTTPEVDAIGSIHFRGNLIPHTWYRAIRFAPDKRETNLAKKENREPAGKPDLVAITLLSEVCYWYRPVVEKDELTGAIVSIHKRFKGDMLQRSYVSFANQFGITKRQASEAIKRLVGLDLLIIEFRTLEMEAGTLSSVLFLKPNVQKVLEISGIEPPQGGYQLQSGHPQLSNAPPPTFKRDTPQTRATTDVSGGVMFKRDGGHIQTLGGSQLSAEGIALECETYTIDYYNRIQQNSIYTGAGVLDEISPVSPASSDCPTWTKLLQEASKVNPNIQGMNPNARKILDDFDLSQDMAERRMQLEQRFSAYAETFGGIDRLTEVVCRYLRYKQDTDGRPVNHLEQALYGCERHATATVDQKNEEFVKRWQAEKERAAAAQKTRGEGAAPAPEDLSLDPHDQAVLDQLFAQTDTQELEMHDAD